MPYAGSIYSLPLTDVIPDTAIASTWANTTLNDLETALNSVLLRDGSAAMTGPLNMGNQAITAIAPETWLALASLLQVQTYTAFTTGGTATAYTLTPVPALTAYTVGASFWVTFHLASGAAPTLTISGVATPPNLVRRAASGAYVNLVSGEVPANYKAQVTLVSATQALVQSVPGEGSPAGTVIWHAAATAPPGYIKANGAALSRTLYAPLFAVIGTSWGPGDGSTTFNVPDLRGEFIRGWDDSKGTDPGRAFSSFQAQQLIQHAHTHSTAHGHSLSDPGHTHVQAHHPNPNDGGRYGLVDTGEGASGMAMVGATSGIGNYVSTCCIIDIPGSCHSWFYR